MSKVVKMYPELRNMTSAIKKEKAAHTSRYLELTVFMGNFQIWRTSVSHFIKKVFHIQSILYLKKKTKIKLS